MPYQPTSGCPLIASLTTAIVLLLAPFTPITAYPPASPPIGPPPGVTAEVLLHDIVTYVEARDLAAYLDYQVALDAQRAAQAAEAAHQAQMAQEAAEEAYRAAQARPAPVQSVPQPVARTSGGHSDAWWRGVAQCEQGGRNDPYFGYFSFMDGSMGGQPWDVQVAAGNALLASVGSESPAWAPSCVAAGYAASPSG